MAPDYAEPSNLRQLLLLYPGDWGPSAVQAHRHLSLEGPNCLSARNRTPAAGLAPWKDDKRRCRSLSSTSNTIVSWDKESKLMVDSSLIGSVIEDRIVHLCRASSIPSCCPLGNDDPCPPTGPSVPKAGIGKGHQAGVARMKAKRVGGDDALLLHPDMNRQTESSPAAPCPSRKHSMPAAVKVSNRMTSPPEKVERQRTKSMDIRMFSRVLVVDELAQPRLFCFRAATRAEPGGSLVPDTTCQPDLCGADYEPYPVMKEAAPTICDDEEVGENNEYFE